MGLMRMGSLGLERGYLRRGAGWRGKNVCSTHCPCQGSRSRNPAKMRPTSRYPSRMSEVRHEYAHDQALSPEALPESGYPSALLRRSIRCDCSPICLAHAGRLRGGELAAPFDDPSRNEVVRVAGKPVAATEGRSDTSPSKMTLQRAGDNFVTTSRPHPQGHRCPAVAYFTEM